MSAQNYKQLLTKAASICREASAQLRASSSNSSQGFSSLSDIGELDNRSKVASESGGVYTPGVASENRWNDYLLGNLGGND